MAAAVRMGEENVKAEKEGSNLLGPPSFTELGNGRFKCVETGHELFAKDKESYSLSKRCRLGLIDFALANKKSPLNMFKQEPVSRSKLICKLTGDTVNKSEEHIWKHINGKRFLNKLEQKETGKLASVGEEEEKVKKKREEKSSGGRKKKKQERSKKVEESVSEARNSSGNNSDSEEADFWIPLVGERWDFDDGGDRWGSDSDSGQEREEEKEADDGPVEDNSMDSGELPDQSKRLFIETKPSSFVPRKKKSRKNFTS